MLSPKGRGPSAATRGSGQTHVYGRIAPFLAPALLGACVSYQPAPLEPSRVLHDLDDARWSAELERSDNGSTPRQLAALAITYHPTLKALRAEHGVARARLVEAGLLPDPEFGWDAMDVLAAEIEGGGAGSQEVLSGLGLMFPLLRPGERGAREDAAEWRRIVVLNRVLTAEWRLTRDVHIACEEVFAAERLLAQTTELTRLARSTDDYFQRAKAAGAATAIQANLAQGQLFAFDLDVVGTEARVRTARQELNALLGLPPAFEVQLSAGEDASGRAELAQTPAELTAQAVENRPELAEAMARYEVAEQEVRLAVAQQYPLVAIGTGISITPGLFSRFGRPALNTALARRDQLGREVEALVHEVRQEIAAAVVQWNTARKELELIETRLLPNAESTLALSQAAFDAGEMTLLESLALQRSLVEARTRHTEARAELSKSAWTLLAASGRLLTPNSPTQTAHEELAR